MFLLSIARASAWLLQATSTLPDTIVARQIIQRGWFDQTTHVAAGLLILLLLLLAVLVIPTAWYLRHRLGTLTQAVEGLRADVKPVMEQTNRVMENAEAISSNIRREVERLSETVQRFDGQLREVADIAGDRVRDFDVLLGAVQDEAEGLFLTTASTVRGIRAGVRALRRHRSRRNRRRAELDLPRADGEDSEDDAPRVGTDDEHDEPRGRVPRLRRRRRAT